MNVSLTENIDEILDISNFQKAFNKIKLRNSAVGIDEVSISEFNLNFLQYCNNLIAQVKSKEYYPEPYLQFFMHKKQGKFRPISLLTLKDKLLQAVITDYYSNYIDKIFVNTSYAYRPGKGHRKAIGRIKDYIVRKNKFAVTLDIKNFFDSIDHNILINKVKEIISNETVINLIEMWIKIGVIYNNKYVEHKVGIAQGGAISPLLSNIYLNSLDKLLFENNINNVRYADNIILLDKDKKKLIEAFRLVKYHLKNELKLNLHESECDIKNLIEGFVFCGIEFKNNTCSISKEKLNDIELKIKALSNIQDKIQLENKLKDIVFGLRNYYISFDTEIEMGRLVTGLIDVLVNDFYSKKLLTKTEIKVLIKSSQVPSLLPKQPSSFIYNLLESTIYKAKTPDEKEEFLRRRLEIKSRKYKKVWYSDLDLIVSSSYCSIGKLNNNIVVRQKRKTLNQVSIKNIRAISISGKNVSISSEAIKLISEKEVKLNFFDSLGKPYATLIPSVQPLARSVTKQIEITNSDKAKEIIIKIIEAKIKNQLSTLKYYRKSRKDLIESELWDVEFNSIDNNLIKLKEIDFDLELDDFRNKVLGLEGSSASSYWRLFAKLIPEYLNFNSRKHQNADDTVNIMLNYGYGILYTRILTAVTLAGLNPTVGFLHKMSKDKPALVFDLIENFRSPAVDKTVVAFLSKAGIIDIEKNKFPPTLKSKYQKKILTKLNKEFYYNKKLVSLNSLFVSQTKNLKDFIEGKDKFKPYLAKW